MMGVQGGDGVGRRNAARAEGHRGLALERLESRVLLDFTIPPTFGYAVNLDTGTGTGPEGVVRIFGDDAAEESGFSVSSAGDVNGDGYDDVLIGAPLADQGAYLAFGKPTGNWADIDFDGAVAADTAIRIYADDPGDDCGYFVAAAGDVNDDDYDDFLVGARTAYPGGRSKAGEVYLVFGHDGAWADIDLDTGTDTGPAGVVRFFGDDASDYFGWTLSGAGDVNNDGWDDIFIGAPWADPAGGGAAGEAYVIFGHDGAWSDIDFSGAVATDTAIRIFGDDGDDTCATSVATGGDLNGDGYDDLLLGAPWANPAGGSLAGEAYIVFGHGGAWADIDLNTGTDTGPAGVTRIFGDDGADYTGYYVNFAGDVNDDGYDDALVGAPDADGPDTPQTGRTYLVFGHGGAWIDLDLNTGTGTGPEGVIRIFGDNNGEDCGRAVSSAGDVDADGYDDILIGAWGSGSAGGAYLVFGHGGTWADIDFDGALSGRTAVRVFGDDSADGCGCSVAGAGDVNDDGYSDFLVGARSANPAGGDRAGESYLVFGRMPASVMSGVKFDDTDGDGVQDAGESGLPLWTIYIDTDDDGELDWTDGDGDVTWDEGEGEQWTVTDKDGAYSLNGLNAGTYNVREVNQDAWLQTVPASPDKHVVVLGADEEQTGIDFGNQFMPIPGVPDLLPGSDTGVSASDDLTARDNSDTLRRLSFLVGDTVPGATVTIYANGTAIGSAIAGGTSTTVTTDGVHDLPDDLNFIEASQTPVGGVESLKSGELAIFVDTVPPVVDDASITCSLSVDAGEAGVANAGDVIRAEWDSGEPAENIWIVWLNVSEFGGSWWAMYDNGTNGDTTSGDGIWTIDYTVPFDSVMYENATPGVSATDKAGLMTDGDDGWSVMVNNTGLLPVGTWDGGGPVVNAYRLDGSADIDADNIAVKFGKKGDARIKLGGTQTMAGLGIIVSGADPVSIGDGRRDAGDLAFVASDAAIKSVKLKSGLSGYNLNGLTLGGIDFPDDVDGDGDMDDAVALYVDGFLSMAQFGGGVNGDVWVGGADGKGVALRTFQVKNGGYHGDMVLLGHAGKIALGGDLASSIHVAGNLKSLDVKGGDLDGPVTVDGYATKIGVAAAKNRATGLYAGGTVTANGVITIDGEDAKRGVSLKQLAVKGGGLAGDVTTLGDLGKVSVAGGDVTSQLTVGGGLGGVAVKSAKDRATGASVGGSAVGSRFDVVEMLKSLKLTGDFTDSDVDAGELSKVRVKGVIGQTGGTHEIRAAAGSYTLQDATWKGVIDATTAYDFAGGLHAWVG